MNDRLPPSTAPPAPGPVAGRYRLLEELGRGGMAVVHRGVDEVLEREVAIKVLHPHLAEDDVALDRFRREARAAAAVDHPGVVRVHDWGVDGHRPFLVMELVRGRTLRQVLRVRGRLTPGETLALLMPAAGGLAAAHDAGLVHRDVTPNNLLVDEHGTTKVGDFGLARSAAAATSTRNQIVGSPHYLAPEAVRGETLTVRADVYALGCVLFECLTGSPPYEADSPVAVAARHTTERVPAPSTRVAGISPALDRVVTTATAPDPEDRHADAHAFALALSAAVPDGPVAIDLRDGPGGGGTIVPIEHATRTLHELGATTVVGSSGPSAPASRRRWRRLLAVLVGLALVAGGGWVGFDRVLAPVTAVPSVVGFERAAAVTALEDAGFRVRVAEQGTTHPTIPVGSVVEQRPDGDARQRMTTVELVLSDGPATATLPSLEDLTADEVEQAVRDLGLDIEVERAEGFHDEVPPGAVLAVTDGEGLALGEGSVVAEGTTVVVTVSAGPAPVDVPGLVGREESAALSALVEVGLTGRVVERRFDDEAPAGTVLSADPPADTTVRRGDEVDLIVSDGPAPVTVPDVTGSNEREAIARLRDLGLQVEVRDVPTIIPFRSGRVDSQDPSGGSEARRGDTVLLFVWR